jgi:cholesterol transport system auxiliary component
MSILYPLVPLTLALLLGACSLGKPALEANYYVIEPLLPATVVADRRGSLRIGSVRVAAAFASEELVYRMSDVRFERDFYERFINEPGSMLGERLADWLEATGPFQTVTQNRSATSVPFVLEAVVTELYGDFRPEQPPAAVMYVQFTVLDTRPIRPRLVLERGIARRVEIDGASAGALVRGYNWALGEILGELAAAMADLPRR